MHAGVTVVALSEALVFEVIDNMRDSDRREAWAVSPVGADAPAVLARDTFDRSRFGAVAIGPDGAAAAAWGAVEVWPGTWSVWLLATDAWPAVWRAAVRWLLVQLPAIMRAAGMRCLFVFAQTDRADSAALLRRIGFKPRGAVPRFGRDGSSFTLWSRTGEAR